MLASTGVSIATLLATDLAMRSRVRSRFARRGFGSFGFTTSQGLASMHGCSHRGREARYAISLAASLVDNRCLTIAMRCVLLVAARQHRKLPSHGCRQEPEPDILPHLLAEPLDQRYPPAHPALVPAQQYRDLRLRESIFSVEGRKHHGLFQFTDRPRFNWMMAAFITRSVASRILALSVSVPI